MAEGNNYPATIKVKYQKELDRVSSVFRFVWAIPILVIIGILTSGETTTYVTEETVKVTESGMGIASALAAVTMLMILFRQRYPKWWFNFALELTRFSARVTTYLLLLTDKYPSTEDHQNVQIEVEYPNVKKDLNRWLPLVKWLLAIPHYIVLSFLAVAVLFSTVVAWFSILFSGTYPRSLFDFVVGVGRWALRVNAYAFLLVTDEYPPFSLK